MRAPARQCHVNVNLIEVSVTSAPVGNFSTDRLRRQSVVLLSVAAGHYWYKLISHTLRGESAHTQNVGLAATCLKNVPNPGKASVAAV